MYTTRVAIATGRDSAIILVIVFFVTEHYLLLQRERERERERDRMEIGSLVGMDQQNRVVYCKTEQKKGLQIDQIYWIGCKVYVAQKLFIFHTEGD